jgi:hypothetical protein
MNEALMRKTNLFGAWCGVFYIVLLLFGWFVVAGFFPMQSPSDGAAQIAAFFRTNPVAIKVGMVIVMWGAATFIPFTAALSDYVSKVEGRSGPLTKITMMAGYANAMLTFYPPLYWIANTFRAAERPDDMIYMLNDLAWLQFIGGLSLIMPMFVTVAVAAFSDKSANPAFPRWSAYVSILTFLLFLPDQMLFFFKSGPFAWNGLFAFWIPLTVFGGWFFMIFYLIRRSILQEESQLKAGYLGVPRPASSAF